VELQVVRLGCMNYIEVLRIQEALQHHVMTYGGLDTLLLLEHPPVITKGVRGEDENILLTKEQLAALGVEIIETKRGGDVTYLGPGQVIGYPIMNLKRHGKDIQDFVSKIEQIIVQIMKEDFHVDTIVGSKKYTGVFVDNDKIAAIGIAVSRWVTMHGFAFNVNTNLSHFNWIIPCGLKDRGVTSVEKIIGKPYDMIKLQNRIIEKFETSFQVKAIEMTKEDLIHSMTKAIRAQSLNIMGEGATHQVCTQVGVL